MLQIPIVVWQAHELDQLEMSDNCFSVENRISLAQASQKPVKPFEFTNMFNSQGGLGKWEIITNQSYTYYTDMVTIIKPVPYLYTTAKVDQLMHDYHICSRISRNMTSPKEH